jgi:MFS superfamily sulfate permease-like transporter
MQNPNAPGRGFTLFAHLKSDFLASVVVFLVALPLCLGIALASGLPAAAGLITGIVGGLVVAWLAGSPLQVSGPAAGLTVIVYEIVQRYREEYLRANAGQEADALRYAVGMLGLALVVCGVLQILAGACRLGQWFRAVSPAVVHGMLAGIGVLIVASQFHVMVDDKPHGHGLDNLVTLPGAVWKGLVDDDDPDTNHHWAARVGVLTILVLVLWKALAPKRLRVLPAPLVAIAAGAAATAVLGVAIHFVAMPDNPLGAVVLPDLPFLQPGLGWPVLTTGLTLAVVASAETLLCAGAVDQLHQGPRTKYDRELAAQGVGNLICGVLGALPMTGVIVRSAANVEAGAKTRLSAVLHGAWLLVFVALLPWLVRLVPTASLAAVLVYTGFKLVDWKMVRSLWALSRSEVLVYAVTVVTIVATDLLTGVLAGVAAAALKLLYTFSRLSIRTEAAPGGRRTTMHLRGTATFLRLPKLAEALERVPANTELHVHIEHLDYIDHACLELLMTWEKQHEATGGSLVLDWDTLTARFRHPGRRHAPPVAPDGVAVGVAEP